MKELSSGPMLNAYPDSIGGQLSDIVAFLSRDELKNVFSSFYILPSVFNTDLDRGFSVVDYSLSEDLARREDLDALRALGLDLKLDFVLNHASVLSPQFQSMLHDPDSPYKDFFINWNEFWKGEGEMTEEGYILPDKKHLDRMFFRKPGLPILMVRMPDGRDVPYWNTFYQQVDYQVPTVQQLMHASGLQYTRALRLHQRIAPALAEGKTPAQLDFSGFEEAKQAVCGWLEAHREYLGQMDLNIRSPLVWQFYDDTLKTLAGYGARIVRLDAFAYAPKAVGEKNFLNEPGTWDLLAKVDELAKKYDLDLLPEIHASYGEKIYEKIARKGYMTYDFFLPGLLIDAFEHKNADYLRRWAGEIQAGGLRVVNMLGCHDGIPLLDLKGLMPDERIQGLIDAVVARGGYVKDLHGAKNMYYQVNATYYSALGEDDAKMALARAIQMFMPGKPQVWYLDLFCGKNDHEAVRRAGPGGHKEINRTNIPPEAIDGLLQNPCVLEQLDLLRLRSTHPAFGFDSELEIGGEGSTLELTWRKGGEWVSLHADLARATYSITGTSL
ncbi:MAG TPA: glycosidase [Candidatus Fournierella excrementavium]|uniref:glycosidase n=3 Tax=Allofournierella TaxID=1940255 RepID=UPI001F8EF0B9|nr:glycosidase [Fournierella sp.]MEE0757219.1 glycosidase [Fournierella sp.]HJD18243.1 glycosidase [Candidatus Fournierella excrementavium]